MFGAQLASRVLYPRLRPRRHIAAGLTGVAVSIGLLSLLGAQSSLWWARLLMFTLGFAMGQVFVPTQAAAFATITPAATLDDVQRGAPDRRRYRRGPAHHTGTAS